MTSFAMRIRKTDGPHVRVQIFAGPDEQHRALTGDLMMSAEEAEDFALITKLPAARR